MNLKLSIVLTLILFYNPTFAMHDKKAPESQVAKGQAITITGLQYCQQFPQHMTVIFSNGKQLSFNNCAETFAGKMKIPSPQCTIETHKKTVVSLTQVSFPYCIQIPCGPKITFKDSTTMKLQN